MAIPPEARSLPRAYEAAPPPSWLEQRYADVQDHPFIASGIVLLIFAIVLYLTRRRSRRAR
jgi:hypothetical protein